MFTLLWKLQNLPEGSEGNGGVKHQFLLSASKKFLLEWIFSYLVLCKIITASDLAVCGLILNLKSWL